MSFTLSKTRPISAELLAVTADNFPALKHVFAFAGCNFTARTITDPMGGAVTGAYAVLTDNGNKTFAQTGAAAIGTGLTAPNTKDTLIVLVGKSTLANIGGGILDQTNTIFALRTGTGSTLASTNQQTAAVATNFVTNAAITIPNPSADVAAATSVVWSTGVVNKYVVESTDTTVTTNVGTVTVNITQGILTSDMVNASISFNVSGVAYYGLYIFYFTNGLPSAATITAGMAWMSKNPGYVAPHFRNMA